MNPIKSTIIIPNYNGMKYLENCLHSLRTEAAHILIVDNGSSDGSAQWLKEYVRKQKEQKKQEKRVETEERVEPENQTGQIEHILLEENTGFCKAVNLGIRAAKTEYVIFLNNDTVVEKGFVQALEQSMEQDNHIFSGSAKMLSMKEKEKIDDAGDLYCAFGWAYALGKGKPEKFYQKQYDIFASCGGAAIYRKSVLEQIGLLDENHFAYLEDIDLGYRAQIYGYRNVFVPSARVYHAGSASSGSRYNKFKVDLTSKNSVYLIYKNMPILQILLNLPFLFLGFLIKTLFFMKKGLGKAYVTGLLRGLRLCASKSGRQNKVPFCIEHLGNYVKIQLALWVNLIRRLY